MRALKDTGEGGERSEGASMAEMMIVVLILGVVLAIVQGTVILANRTNNQTSGRVESTADARVAIDSMSKNLRTAVLPQLLSDGNCPTCATVAFVQGTPTSVQFYANNNTDQARLGPSKVTYTLTGKTITESIQKPDAHAANVYSYQYCTPGPTCVVPTRILARGVTSSRLFTYYDKAGSALSGSSLTAAQLATVDSMDVVVPVVARGQTSTVVQRVTLPNADSIAQPTQSP